MICSIIVLPNLIIFRKIMMGGWGWVGEGRGRRKRDFGRRRRILFMRIRGMIMRYLLGPSWSILRIILILFVASRGAIRALTREWDQRQS